MGRIHDLFISSDSINMNKIMIMGNTTKLIINFVYSIRNLKLFDVTFVQNKNQNMTLMDVFNIINYKNILNYDYIIIFLNDNNIYFLDNANIKNIKKFNSKSILNNYDFTCNDDISKIKVGHSIDKNNNGDTNSNNNDNDSSNNNKVKSFFQNIDNSIQNRIELQNMLFDNFINIIKNSNKLDILVEPILENSVNKFLNHMYDTKCDFVFNIMTKNPNSKIDKIRMQNLNYILENLNKYDKFTSNSKIIIVEQGGMQQFYPNVLQYKSLNIDYHFIYNPYNFNRGWGYNVAAKYYCQNDTIVLMDSDIIIDETFFININDCNKRKYLFINPYKYIYFTSEKERESIFKTNNFNFVTSSNHKPVTFSGGILICNRNKYLELGGFEEFTSYGFEDRALDILIDNFININDLQIVNKTLVHLWHPTNTNKPSDECREFFYKKYNCNRDYRKKVKKTDYIHIYCKHKSKEVLQNYINEKIKFNSNIDIYKNYKINELKPNNFPKKIKYINNMNDTNDTNGTNDNIKLVKYNGINKNIELDMNIYSNYLKNKRVVVVGPAPSIIGSKQKELIDSYDVIVRINKAFPIPSDLMDDIGTRTDILYNCLNPHPENGGPLNMAELKKNVKWIACPYPNIDPFNKNIDSFINTNKKYGINFNIIDKSKYLDISRKMDTRPNSGVLTILDLLNYDIQELYITGITFFKGGYYKKYRNYNEEQVLERMRAAGNHDQNKQFEYMKNILLNDKRVKCDDKLNEILINGLNDDLAK